MEVEKQDDGIFRYSFRAFHVFQNIIAGAGIDAETDLMYAWG